MTPLAWITTLVALGLALVVLEVFVPSGGVLGFLSVLAIGAAIVTAFVEQGPTFGAAVTGVAFVVVPAVLAAAFRVFPETPLGRRVLPPPPGADDVQPRVARRRHLETFVGRRCRVSGELVPWGTVEIDGVACEARSDAGPVAVGAAVEVVGADATALVVRPLAPGRPAPRRPAGAGSSPAAQADQAAADGRSRTLEEFEFDDLEPPAA